MSEPIDYPPEPWHLRGHMHASAWAVPVGELPELPPGVRPLTVAGRAFVLAAWVDYQPPGVLSYRELMVTVVVRGGLTVTIPHIWVDSPASLAGGRALWHIPKDLAEFTLTDGPEFAAEARAGGERAAGRAPSGQSRAGGEPGAGRGLSGQAGPGGEPAAGPEPSGDARAGGSRPAGPNAGAEAGAGGDYLAGPGSSGQPRAGGGPVAGREFGAGARAGGEPVAGRGLSGQAGAGGEPAAGAEPSGDARAGGGLPAGPNAGAEARTGGEPVTGPKLGGESRAGEDPVPGPKLGAESRAGQDPVAGPEFSAEARAGGDLLAGAEFRRRHALPLRVPLAFSVLQRGPKRSRVRVAARLGVARSVWRVGAGGPLAFLAGRRPLVSLVARDFRMRFGGDPVDA